MALEPLVIRRDSWHFRFWCFWEGRMFDHPRRVKEGPIDTCGYYGDLTAFFVMTIFFPLIVIIALVGLIWLIITKFWLGLGIGVSAVVILTTAPFLPKSKLGRSIATWYRAAERRLCRPIEIVDGVADRGVARNEGVRR